MSVSDVSLFAGKEWKVHKFGGTSVANADCFLRVAHILEDALGLSRNDGEGASCPNLAIVVSAIGGKPKTTDLLLSTVQAAASRDDAGVKAAIEIIMEKHTTCLEALFADLPAEKERLLQVVRNDLDDIQDILKTVALMKWQAERISELVSGYGELWSTQILAALLQMRSRNRSSPPDASLPDTAGGEAAPLMPCGSNLSSNASSISMDIPLNDDGENDGNGHDNNMSQVTHEFYYVDARRVIILDEDAIQHGAICWDVSQTKLQDVYQEAYNSVHPRSMLHLVMTGYVASNTHGVPTTLQRDGSDYSAAILGRLLNATQVNIWTDVDGCLSADPRRVPSAFVIPDVSYSEAMELSYFGAKVIHPKTMQPAISANPQIPIYIRNTFNPKFRGTRIYVTSTTQSGDNDKCVCGFSSIEHMALINVEGTGTLRKKTPVALSLP
jgi:aspartokinase